MKQWQEILQMIVKRLQLSEAFGKIMKDVESMESSLESVALPQNNPQQLFHSQQDLENHIQTLKVREIIINSSFFPYLLQRKERFVSHATFCHNLQCTACFTLLPFYNFL